MQQDGGGQPVTKLTFFNEFYGRISKIARPNVGENEREIFSGDFKWKNSSFYVFSDDVVCVCAIIFP